MSVKEVSIRKLLPWRALGGILLATVLAVPAWCQSTPPVMAGEPGTSAGEPGTLNFVEGQASIGNSTVNRDSIGVRLQPGQTLSTQDGKAEILLTPGAFLRLGEDSAVQMGFESPAAMAATLTKGQAAVEVLAADKHTVLTMSMQNTSTRLLKTGLYEFDANTGQVFVFHGEAKVQTAPDHRVKVKSGHELTLNQSGKLKARKFDKKKYEESDLIQFSGRRSEYLAEANANAAGSYYNGGAGWYGPGWYWDPAFWAYTWIPGEDYYVGPFGWGFYSPFWVGYDPFYYGGFFGDFGFGSFGHEHFGRHRLPHTFSARGEHGEHGRFGGHGHFGDRNHFEGQPPAMANRAGRAGSGFHGPAFNRGGMNEFSHAPSTPAFNRGGFHGGFEGSHVGGFHGGFSGGGSHGGGFHGGGFHGGGFHGGGFHGGGFGGGFHGGGFGGRR